MNYFKRKFAGPFERPYGWAWILKLQAELEKNAKVLLNIRLKDAKNMARIQSFLPNIEREHFSTYDLSEGNRKPVGRNPSPSFLTCCLPATWLPPQVLIFSMVFIFPRNFFSKNEVLLFPPKCSKSRFQASFMSTK